MKEFLENELITVSYEILNLLSKTSPSFFNIGLISQVSGMSSESPKYIKTRPSLSMPLLPALPAI